MKIVINSILLAAGVFLLLPLVALNAQAEGKAKLDLFTTILGYERPGSVYGEAKYCVAAEGMPEADMYLLDIADRELQEGWRFVNSTIIPGCPWMPSDED